MSLANNPSQVPNLPMLEALPPTRPLSAVQLTRGTPPPTLISMMSAAQLRLRAWAS